MYVLNGAAFVPKFELMTYAISSICSDFNRVSNIFSDGLERNGRR